MNSKWFGDSYDIVKRFFIGLLKDAGYMLYIEPMSTGSWENNSIKFLSFLGAPHLNDYKEDHKPSALFVDPDTGIKECASAKHCSYTQLMAYTCKHDIVFVFDQSFSYSQLPTMQMKTKLAKLGSL